MSEELTPSKWIGVDFDGTLSVDAEYRTDPYQLGEPVPVMVDRVKRWLKEGRDVRLFTARMSNYSYTAKQFRDLNKMEAALKAWCLLHIGAELPCTNAKDGLMEELWDDRAIQVEANTGRLVTSK